MADTMTAAEVAAYLHLHPDTVLILAGSGEIDGAKIGRAWTFYRPHIEAYLLKQIKQQTQQRRMNRLPKPLRELATA